MTKKTRFLLSAASALYSMAPWRSTEMWKYLAMICATSIGTPANTQWLAMAEPSTSDCCTLTVALTVAAICGWSTKSRCSRPVHPAPHFSVVSRAEYLLLRAEHHAMFAA